MNGTKTKKVLWKFGFFMALAAALYLAGALNIFTGVRVQADTFPPGDACTDAVPIGEVINLSFDTTGARFGGRGLCMVSPNIWYCYTASSRADHRTTKAIWDLFNEPDNMNVPRYRKHEPVDKPERVRQLLAMSFAWAREVNPGQPITAGIWLDYGKARHIKPCSRANYQQSGFERGIS